MSRHMSRVCFWFRSSSKSWILHVKYGSTACFNDAYTEELICICVSQCRVVEAGGILSICANMLDNL